MMPRSRGFLHFSPLLFTGIGFNGCAVSPFRANRTSIGRPAPGQFNIHVGPVGRYFPAPGG
jgi:hypothetical protein